MPTSLPILAAVLALVAAPAAAQEHVRTPVVAVQEAAAPEGGAGAPDARTQPSLGEFLWIARPLVVFADTPNDPRFAQQMRELEEDATDLAERSVVVLVDTDPAADGPLRRELRPRGFGIVLIDTDGSVVQRRPDVTTAREIWGAIDRLPSWRQESGSRRR